MRRQPTEAERRLWLHLRNRQLAGLKFRRQHPVGRFVLDFYCPAKKLVIELDGSAHEGRATADAERSLHLAAHDYTVLRFDNDDVRHDLSGVLRRIETIAAGLPDQPAAKYRGHGPRRSAQPPRPDPRVQPDSGTNL
jgi:very-short-patch-repair endonuclease